MVKNKTSLLFNLPVDFSSKDIVESMKWQLSSQSEKVPMPKSILMPRHTNHWQTAKDSNRNHFSKEKQQQQRLRPICYFCHFLIHMELNARGNRQATFYYILFIDSSKKLGNILNFQNEDILIKIFVIFSVSTITTYMFLIITIYLLQKQLQTVHTVIF